MRQINVSTAPCNGSTRPCNGRIKGGTLPGFGRMLDTRQAEKGPCHVRLFETRAQRDQTRLRPGLPRPAQDRHGIALVLIVRNEARHIAEWARFHLAAGVRYIHAYDNGRPMARPRRCLQRPAARPASFPGIRSCATPAAGWSCTIRFWLMPMPPAISAQGIGG